MITMLLNRDEIDNANQISSYHSGELIINEQSYTHSVIITPQQIISPWSATTAETIDEQATQTLLDLNPKIVVLGIGDTTHLLTPAFYAKFHAQHIGLEVMTNDAACRTFNVLVSEGRNVVAGILLP